MVKNLLKMIQALESLQQAEHLRMLNVWAEINRDRQLTGWELEADPRDSKNYCVWDFDVGMRFSMKHVMTKFVPQLLLLEQKEHRAAVANDLIQTATNEPDFLKKLITRDESWVYGYDPETKAQS